MTIPAIIVVTYNRPHSLNRLLQSLASAKYDVSNIPLIISIDYEDSDSHRLVLREAQNFDWKFGSKRIIKLNENLGLRDHVIKCGNLSSEYDAIIMLEDDLYVSPHFYNYTLQMLDVYGNESRIAGISLYKHEWNVNVNRPFVPEMNGFDVFFFQFAQSWGQCWTAGMWHHFHSWYVLNQSEAVTIERIPAFVSSWPRSSWLKHFIMYLVTHNKYFIYPNISLTTNFSDTGTHIKSKMSLFQVMLQNGKINYKTPSLTEAVKYDVFFERQEIGKLLNLEENELCVDLYGSKVNIDKRYLLTMEIKPFHVVKSFGLDLRPHENNAIQAIEGEDIYLYDTEIAHISPNRNKNNYIIKIKYDYRSFTFRTIIIILIDYIQKKLRNLIF